MRHLLMDPAFPDIVGGYAVDQVMENEAAAQCCANDNVEPVANDLADPFFMVMARREIAASRLW